jgi:hypothetical protein
MYGSVLRCLHVLEAAAFVSACGCGSAHDLSAASGSAITAHTRLVIHANAVVDSGMVKCVIEGAVPQS